MSNLEAGGVFKRRLFLPHDTRNTVLDVLGSVYLAEVTAPPDASSAGREVHTRKALLPQAIVDERLQVRQGPSGLGAHGLGLLMKLGCGSDQVQQQLADGVVGGTNRAERSPELNAGPGA